jgi:hypothetical protein
MRDSRRKYAIVVLVVVGNGCVNVQRTLDTVPKLVIVNEKESRIACTGGVDITTENQGKYSVRFRELTGSSIGMTEIHGVSRVETNDLSDLIRTNFGLYPMGNEKQDSVLKECLGTEFLEAKRRPSDSVTPPPPAPAVAPGNPYEPNSPCWQWYNVTSDRSQSCKDDQNTPPPERH